MTNDEIMNLLILLDTPLEVLDYEGASGVVIEISIPATDYVQVVGPYPKDTAEAMEVIERLRGEIESDEAPVFFKVRLLFPPSSAAAPSA